MWYNPIIAFCAAIFIWEAMLVVVHNTAPWIVPVTMIFVAIGLIYGMERKK